MPLRIEDYALIGDCETAALVGKDGSIDWLCVPDFSSGACFSALLGTPDNGRWLLAPKGGGMAARRQYRDDTLILETEFDTPDGAVTVVDCMPQHAGQTDLVRTVVGRRGSVPMHMELVLRFDYGSAVPWVRRRGNRLTAVAGPDAVVVDSKVELHGADLRTTADFTVAAGQEVPFTLTWHPSAQPPPRPLHAADAVRRTDKWWRDWSSRCTYQGQYRQQVLRSLITLKAQTFAPTGGIVAAPTTSLPEQLGGVRNWDYRYCWLRDATFTLFSLMQCGYTEEAGAWRDWLLRAVAGSPDQLNILYGIHGERRLIEVELKWLPGYQGAKPVRTGNAACEQLQLDVFGELMDALHVARQNGLPENEDAWRVQRVVLDHLEKLWHEPDDGIWEIRGERRQFVHSKVMAWVAFDRGIKDAEEFGVKGPVDEWKKQREAIRAEVLEKGFDRRRNTFTQYYGSKELDASLLMIPLVGFLDAKDPRVAGTVAAIEKELEKDGFVSRYPTESDVDGLPAGEGTFLPCTFWLADVHALMGDRDKARQRYERLLGLCNDVGLISEEYDVKAKRLVGNFPQAFTHVGLVNTALNLEDHHGPARKRHNTGRR